MSEDNDESKPQENSKKLEPNVQAAIITAISTIIIALITYVIAPYFNPGKQPTFSQSTSPSSTASSDGEDCDRHLKKDIPYKNSHTGKIGQVFGDIIITRTYQCQEGTCFSAKMSFNTHPTDDADGFWSGSHLEIKRYISAYNTSQIWSGKCLTKFVKGTWYFTDKEKHEDRGEFLINY